ncbi:MAG: NAD(P) transhydrogenase subunit alpha [Pseudomonadota bacterium]
MAAASERLARVAEEAANATPEQVSEVGAAAAASAGIDPFVFQLAIFALAVFVGYYVVWSVTPALHTPLMAVTNAISSVIVVGSLIAMGADGASTVTAAFGFVATILAAVNIFGGFLVTERMLSMYKKKG